MLTTLDGSALVLTRNQFFSHAKRRLSRRGSNYALMLIELARFIELSEVNGRPVSDEYVRKVTWRIRQALNPSDMIGRVSGAQFALLVESTENESADELLARAEAILERLCSRLDEVAHFEISANLGVAQCTHGDSALEEGFDFAHVALDEAKTLGRCRAAMYTAKLGVERRQRKQIALALAADLKAGRINVHYQPIYRSHDGAVAGAEALARWHAPGLETSPQHFVSIAEEYGLIDELWRQVASRACRFARELNMNRPTDTVPIYVNLSPTQLQRSDLGQEVALMLEREKCKPEWLRVEITESALLDSTRCEETLRELTRLGVQLSIDDFGTGYSNFRLLTSLPVSSIKLDASLVRVAKFWRKPVLKPLVRMAHDLDLVVVAEGVEHLEELESVRESGCDLFQGFLASEPISSAEFQSLSRALH